MLNVEAIPAPNADVSGRIDVAPVRASVAPNVGEAELARAEHLRTLVSEYFPSVWRFLRRLGFDELVIEDATQDLFLVAARRIEEVTPGRERAFLFGAALRIARKLKRKEARELPVDTLGTTSEAMRTSATPET